MVTARKPANILRQPEGGWLGLSGSGQHAATSGEVKLRNVPRVTVVFPNIVKLRQGEREQVKQHLKQRNNICCLNGTTCAMLQMAFISTRPPLAAASWCIGFAESAQMDSSTSTRCVLFIASQQRLQGVHIALASKFVNAILCKLITQ